MGEKLSDAALDTMFRTARTYNGYTDEPVTEAEIHAIYDLIKMGPTSANQQPARFVWCLSAGGEGQARRLRQRQQCATRSARRPPP